LPTPAIYQRERRVSELVCHALGTFRHDHGRLVYALVCGRGGQRRVAEIIVTKEGGPSRGVSTCGGVAASHVLMALFVDGAIRVLMSDGKDVLC
jgi:hypothetical protein